MYTLFLIGLICVYLAYLASIDRLKNGLALSFIILGFIYAIHFDFGVDLWNYNAHFEATKQLGELKNCFQEKEFGWYTLLWIIGRLGLGFQWIIIINGIVINYIVYAFIRDYVKQRWWTLAVFVYVFTYSLYAISFSMLRQSLAMALFLLSWRFICNKKILLSLLIIILAITIHTSAFMLLPFVLWGYLPVKYNKMYSLSFLFLFVVFFINKEFMQEVLGYVATMGDIGDYLTQRSKWDGSTGFGLGYMLINIPFVLSLFMLYRNKFSNYEKRLIILANIGYLLAPFSQINALVLRLTMYYTIYTIATIPIVYEHIAIRRYRIISILITVFITIYSYFAFFLEFSNSDLNFIEYRTFFNY